MTTIKGPVDVDEMEIPKVTSKEDDIVPEPAEASNSTEGDDNDLDARNDTKVIQPSETSAEAEEKKAIEKEDTEEPRLVRVWYATNRKVNEKGEYTTIRDNLNTFGHMDIPLEVAQHHSPKKSSKKSLQTVTREANAFFDELAECLAHYSDLGITPQVLVALHDYKVDFMESLMEAGHWHEDLKVPGPTIVYSWPSIGKAGSYEPDCATIERSEPEIFDFLTKVSPLCGSTNVNIVSNGAACHGLMRVLQRMSSNQVELTLGQIFLLAPDIDREVFIDLSWLFPKYSTRTTMYVSKVDRDALKSVKRHKAPRAGIFKPLTIVDNIDTVAIANLETNDLHDEKKSQSYEIVTLFYDMYDLMKSNASPQQRLHLSSDVDNGKMYWRLRKL